MLIEINQITKVLTLIALFIALTSSMAKAGNEKWVQDIRDEISEFEAIKNENVDVANHHKAWDYAIMAAKLAEKRYTSALKKSLEAQNRIDSRSFKFRNFITYILDPFFISSLCHAGC
jgi:ribonuclease D